MHRDKIIRSSDWTTAFQLEEGLGFFSPSIRKWGTIVAPMGQLPSGLVGVDPKKGTGGHNPYQFSLVDPNFLHI